MARNSKYKTQLAFKGLHTKETDRARRAHQVAQLLRKVPVGRHVTELLTAGIQYINCHTRMDSSADMEQSLEAHIFGRVLEEVLVVGVRHQ